MREARNNVLESLEADAAINNLDAVLKTEEILEKMMKHNWRYRNLSRLFSTAVKDTNMTPNRGSIETGREIYKNK